MKLQERAFLEKPEVVMDQLVSYRVVMGACSFWESCFEGTLNRKPET